LKKAQIRLMYSQDGEIHIILEDLGYKEGFTKCKYVEKDKAKKISKRESRKLLLLKRE